MASNYANAPIRLGTPVRKTIGATAVAGPDSGQHHGFLVKALCSGQVVYVGKTAAVTTADGFPLYDKETLAIEGRNANEVYFIASASAQEIAVLPFDRV